MAIKDWFKRKDKKTPLTRSKDWWMKMADMEDGYDVAAYSEEFPPPPSAEDVPVPLDAVMAHTLLDNLYEALRPIYGEVLNFELYSKTGKLEYHSTVHLETGKDAQTALKNVFNYLYVPRMGIKRTFIKAETDDSHQG